MSRRALSVFRLLIIPIASVNLVAVWLSGWGAERWRYDAKVDVSLRYAETTSRGVSTWLDPDRPVGTPCRRRIFVATIDGRLIALDAATGAPCQDFGHGGQVNMHRHSTRMEALNADRRHPDRAQRDRDSHPAHTALRGDCGEDRRGDFGDGHPL